MTMPLFDTVAIIGIGLIGSSLAHGIRDKGLAGNILGYDASEEVRKIAADRKILQVTDSLEASVRDADLVILTVPTGAINSVAAEIAQFADGPKILMDTGSVKGSVAEGASGLPDPILFVPAHPVAGTENSGPEAGFGTLFENRWCILTPLDRQDTPYLEAVAKIETLWRGLGSDVTQMSAHHHDVALAVTSHLPHLIAYTLVGAADDIESVTEAEVVKYSAGGFRDFTRIAASDPVMWRDVFLNNKTAVLEVLGRFSEELAVMQRAIRWGDGAALEQAFSRSRALRKAIIDAGQETAEPNFGRKS